MVEPRVKILNRTELVQNAVRRGRRPLARSNSRTNIAARLGVRSDIQHQQQQHQQQQQRRARSRSRQRLPSLNGQQQRANSQVRRRANSAVRQNLIANARNNNNNSLARRRRIRRPLQNTQGNRGRAAAIENGSNGGQRQRRRSQSQGRIANTQRQSRPVLQGRKGKAIQNASRVIGRKNNRKNAGTGDGQQRRSR